MKNWKFDLFTFKQNLTLDQLEISGIVEKHLSQFDKFSEKGLTESLKYNLKSYAYDTDVNRLIESLDEELEEHSLVYDLKDLYKRVNAQDTGMLYRDPLRKILETIQLEDDDARMSAIINELMMYDWVREIKMFVESLTTDPVDKKNLTSGGAKCTKVYSVAEEVEGGHIAFICDRWFLVNDKEVKFDFTNRGDMPGGTDSIAFIISGNVERHLYLQRSQAHSMKCQEPFGRDHVHCQKCGYFSGGYPFAS